MTTEVMGEEKEKEAKDLFEATSESMFGEVKELLSKRAISWLDFSFVVLTHIEEYTIPQYGDKDEDQITEWSERDCLRAVSKRIARYGRNTREGQQAMDFLKMAHEVQIAYEKYKEGKALKSSAAEEAEEAEEDHDF